MTGMMASPTNIPASVCISPYLDPSTTALLVMPLDHIEATTNCPPSIASLATLLYNELPTTTMTPHARKTDKRNRTSDSINPTKLLPPCEAGLRAVDGDGCGQAAKGRDGRPWSPHGETDEAGESAAAAGSATKGAPPSCRHSRRPRGQELEANASSAAAAAGKAATKSARGGKEAAKDKKDKNDGSIGAASAR